VFSQPHEYAAPQAVAIFADYRPQDKHQSSGVGTGYNRQQKIIGARAKPRRRSGCSSMYCGTEGETVRTPDLSYSAMTARL
jgi:hypothetical protein